MPKKSKRKLRVGVIFGGRSGEHEVSLVSAASIMQALDKSKYEIVPIGITKEGRWISTPDSLELLKSGRIPRALKAVLPADPTEKRLLKSRWQKVNGKSKKLVFYGDNQQTASDKLDVIFPVLHGPYGEDGTIQGLFELANIPYVGAGVLGSSIGMDKVVQKQLFEQAGLKVVKFIEIMNYELRNMNYIIKKIENELKYPMFIKPANLGSSVGINKAHHQKELIKFIKEASGYDRKIIIEQGIEKAREIEVSVLGILNKFQDEPQVSLPGEIIASNEFYDYDAKYVDGKSKTIIPAKLPKKIVKEIQEIAKKAFLVTCCLGMARVDFLVQDPTRPHTKKVRGKDKKLKKWQIFLSEINTIPGFTSISMYPKLWQASGLSYPKLLDKLIELAIERHREKNKLKTSYQSKEKWYK